MWLSLERNQIADVSPLSGLWNLEFLRLTGNKISDARPLGRLHRLIGLLLPENEIVELELRTFQNCSTSICVQSNQRSQWPFPLAQIGELNLRDNHISDLSALSRMGSQK